MTNNDPRSGVRYSSLCSSLSPIAHCLSPNLNLDPGSKMARVTERSFLPFHFQPVKPVKPQWFVNYSDNRRQTLHLVAPFASPALSPPAFQWFPLSTDQRALAIGPPCRVDVPRCFIEVVRGGLSGLHPTAVRCEPPEHECTKSCKQEPYEEHRKHNAPVVKVLTMYRPEPLAPNSFSINEYQNDAIPHHCYIITCRLLIISTSKPDIHPGPQKCAIIPT
jgi:hypothetical protein